MWIMRPYSGSSEKSDSLSPTILEPDWRKHKAGEGCLAMPSFMKNRVGEGEHEEEREAEVGRPDVFTEGKYSANIESHRN